LAFRIFSVRLEPLTIIKAHFWDSALMLCSRAASSAARAPDLTPGAKAKTSLGQSCRTPCQLSVHPGGGFSVTLALSGYQPQTVSVRPEAEGATDARRLAPNPVHVDLQAVAPAKKPVAIAHASPPAGSAASGVGSKFSFRLPIAVALPYLPLAHWFGFVPLSAEVMGALALVTITYLAAVYLLKRWFFAHYELT